MAVPGTIDAIEERGEHRIARIDFGGKRRRVDLDFVPFARLGDHVMVHGIHAISVVSSEDAERARGQMSRLGLLDAEIDLIPSGYFED
jgi:Hydrogenase maturation factor